RAHHPIGPPTPLEAIRFRMDQLGYTQRDLVEVLGSKSHTSEVLRGRRRLTLDMIRKLHAAWGIPAEALIADPPARKPRRAAPPKRRKPSPARPPRSVKGRGTVLAPRSEPGARRLPRRARYSAATTSSAVRAVAARVIQRSSVARSVHAVIVARTASLTTRS